jgi:hypothetical protein
LLLNLQSRIPFEEIENITKLTNDKVAISYRKKNVSNSLLFKHFYIRFTSVIFFYTWYLTIHFKNPADTDEFVGIASGILPNFSSFAIKTPVAASSNTEQDLGDDSDEEGKSPVLLCDCCIRLVLLRF